MNYMGITPISFCDGVGVRAVLWLSGCTCHCQGCHNPESWDFNAGSVFDEKAKLDLFNALSKDYIDGITLSGGHPLEYENMAGVLDLIKEIKERFPLKTIWLYTGLELNISNFITLIRGIDKDSTLHNYINYICRECDCIVDGPFIQELRDITSPFCGSTNQRIIDVKQTIANNKIVLWRNKDD